MTIDIDELRREVIETLSSLQTPDGNPVIKNAWFGEELYSGRYVDQVPDIVILADDHVRPRPSIFGELFSEIKSGNYVGAHDSARDSVFMAAGDNINSGTIVGDINIWDLTPLLLNRMGLPVPERVDGVVPKTLERDGMVTSRYPVEHVRIEKAISNLDTAKL
jgi:predicted AlkP superfamily phosphohydrolase/phosphomutase